MTVQSMLLLFMLTASTLCFGFTFHAIIPVDRSPDCFALHAESESETSSTGSSVSSRAHRLKDDLTALAKTTRRGFSASRTEKNRMKQIVKELSAISPTDEPAAAYYKDDAFDTSTLSGKWTLIYTDAPDITSLEAGPLSPAKLGKIGQECTPPYIKNVIEWKRPEWASLIPFSGNEGDRVLQKVCCKGSADKSKPTTVVLKLVGLELAGVEENASDEVDSSNGGPATFLKNFPVELEGPLSLTFGKFDVLYLDDDMRITRTNQGYTAINIREEEWF